MNQSPAEAAHDRILQDISPDLRQVSYRDLLAVAERRRTKEVPQMRSVLAQLVLREAKVRT